MGSNEGNNAVAAKHVKIAAAVIGGGVVVVLGVLSASLAGNEANADDHFGGAGETIKKTTTR